MINVVTISDQATRELVWDALEEYKRNVDMDAESYAKVEKVIADLKASFAWSRS